MGSAVSVRAFSDLMDLNGDRAADVVVGVSDKVLRAWSGKDGSELWHCPGEVSDGLPMPVGDLSGDGIPDLLGASPKGPLRALSGSDGSELWRAEVDGGVKSGPALVDVDENGVPDAAFIGSDDALHILSGKDGGALREVSVGEDVTMSPTLLRIDSDPVPDLVLAGSVVVARSGASGALFWEAEAEPYSEASVDVGDLDADGHPDCILTSQNGAVWAIKTTHPSLRWRAPTPGAVPWTPCLADLDGDRVLDCVGGADDGKVRAHSGQDGRLLWERDIGGGVICTPWATDLDGDGVEECVVASFFGGGLVALSGRDGSVRWAAETDGIAATALARADLDADGVLDFAVVTRKGRLRIVSGRDGSLMPSPMAEDAEVSAALLVDLDRDGVADLVAQTGEEQLVAVSLEERRRLWSCPAQLAILSSPVAANLDGDAVPDLFLREEPIGLAGGGFITAVSGKTGRRLWRVSVVVSFQSMGLLSDPCVADLDGDGSDDCLVGTSDKRLVAISGRDGSILWQHRAEAPVRATPAVADMDGDGFPDCVGWDEAGRVYVLSGRTGRSMVEIETEGPGTSPPVVADLEGDGSLELVLPTGRGCLPLALHEERVRGMAQEMKRLDQVLGNLPQNEGNQEAEKATSYGNQAEGLGRRIEDVSGGESEQRSTGVGGAILVLSISEAGGPTAAGSLESLARLTSAGQWSALRTSSESLLKTSRDRWTRAVAWGYRGQALLRLGQPDRALSCFNEAREGGVLDPEASAYSWLASRAHDRCSTELRGQADERLIAAMKSAPDRVFDAVADAAGSLSPAAHVELGELLERASLSGRPALVAELLRVLPLPDGSRPGSTIEVRRALVDLARVQLAAPWSTAESTGARWVGYLCLLADAVGDRRALENLLPVFHRAEARPGALDRLLLQVERRSARARECREEGSRAERGMSYLRALASYEEAIALDPSDPGGQAAYAGMAYLVAGSMMAGRPIQDGARHVQPKRDPKRIVALLEGAVGTLRALAGRASAARDAGTAMPPLPYWARDEGYTHAQALSVALGQAGAAYLMRGDAGDLERARAAWEEALTLSPPKDMEEQIRRSLDQVRGVLEPGK